MRNRRCRGRCVRNVTRDPHDEAVVRPTVGGLKRALRRKIRGSGCSGNHSGARRVDRYTAPAVFSAAAEEGRELQKPLGAEIRNERVIESTSMRMLDGAHGG